jgi:malate dehydrogenase (oxaloacetate-decarboxylating)
MACHNGLVTPAGEDVSIGVGWRGSMMANAARDPYWQAAVRRETLVHPTAATAIQNECSACHMPMARFQANAEGRQGDIADAMKGADVVVGLSRSGPGVILPEWVAGMAKDAIVFACANPVPEIWPWEAKEAGAAVVATGRSDFDNQVNNSLGFPGIFRGTLDVRARTITDEMCFAAAKALADHVGDELGPEHILPTMDDWEVFPREAAAVGVKAQELGLARISLSYDELLEKAMTIIKRSRDLTHMMMEQGFIAEAPEE